jgi:hypothetical protein
MNEQIKLMAEKADKFASQNRVQNIAAPGNNYFELFHEKFAELIVRECGNIAWKHTPDTEDLEYSHLIKDKILANFGVEE